MSKKKQPVATPDPELTPQQERFCYEYLKDLNGTKAAIRAGYTESCAAQQSSRLLSYVKVSEKIATLKADQLKRIQINSDDILRELSRIGYSDIRKLYDENGAIKPVSQWPKSLARAIASIEVFEEFEFHAGGFMCQACGKNAQKEVIGQTKKVKFWSKDRGLELLGKHKALFADRVEHSGKITLEELLGGSYEKTKED